MIKVKVIRHSERLDYTHPFAWLFCFGQYWSDAPLTLHGHQIAEEKGKMMKTDNFDPKYIYTSPYNRTMATAAEIKKTFPQSQIIIEPLLAEFQGSFAHHINLYPKGIPTLFGNQITNFSYPETYDNFCKRVNFIIFKLIEMNNRDIIIVTHGELLKALVNYFQNEFPETIIDPGTTPYLTILSFEYDKILDKIIKSSIRIE